MIQVHHLNNSRSQRVLWMLEELGVAYEIVHYQRDPKTQLAPESLKEVHPLGKAPVITDGDRTIAESGTILEYLAERFGDGKLLPREEEAKLRSRYWMHYAEGSLMTPLLLKLVFDKVASDSPLVVRPAAWAIAKGVGLMFINPNLKTHFDFVESELAKSTWFTGSEFSMADIQMSFPLEGGEARLDLEDRPLIQAFLARIRKRPAYQRALERGGPFELG